MIHLSTCRFNGCIHVRSCGFSNLGFRCDGLGSMGLFWALALKAHYNFLKSKKGKKLFRYTLSKDKEERKEIIKII